MFFERAVLDSSMAMSRVQTNSETLRAASCTPCTFCRSMIIVSSSGISPIRHGFFCGDGNGSHEKGHVAGYFFSPPFDRLLPAAESGHVGRLIRSSEAVRNDDLGGNRWQFAYAV